MQTAYPKHLKAQTAILLLVCLLQITIGLYALNSVVDFFGPVFLLLYSSVIFTPVVAVFSMVLKRRLRTEKPIILISKILRVFIYATIGIIILFWWFDVTIYNNFTLSQLFVYSLIYLVQIFLLFLATQFNRLLCGLEHSWLWQNIRKPSNKFIVLVVIVVAFLISAFIWHRAVSYAKWISEEWIENTMADNSIAIQSIYTEMFVKIAIVVGFLFGGTALWLKATNNDENNKQGGK